MIVRLLLLLALLVPLADNGTGIDPHGRPRERGQVERGSCMDPNGCDAGWGIDPNGIRAGGDEGNGFDPHG